MARNQAAAAQDQQVIRMPVEKKKVQARIPKPLWIEAEKKLVERGITWVELLEDLISGFVTGKIK